MQIKSIQKTTLIDYPGLIASVIFLGGCNFRCDYCYNKALVNAPHTIPNLDEQEVLTFLDKRKKIIEGIVITGGEPTVQPGLKQFIVKLKNLGLKIKLDSNGYNPDALEEIINARIIDYIAMDIKAPLHKYSEVTGVPIDQTRILRSIDLIKNSGIDHEFRTTVWRKFFTEQDFLDIYGLIKGSNNYYIQNSYNLVPNIDTYTPMQKSEICSIMHKGKDYVKNIALRGNWY